MDRWLWLVVMGFSLLVYFPLNKRRSKYYWKSRLDDMVPLVPVFAIAYLSYFVLPVLGGIALFESNMFVDFSKSFLVSQILALLFWYFVPNGVKRKKVEGKDVWERMIQKIYDMDNHDTNGFPSAHVMHSVTIGYFWAMTSPEYSVVIWSWVVIIIMSTVFTKQHYLIDVLGGVVWAFLGILLI